MTRMIERWFPCAEVSANSKTGWGSGSTERNLFTWFAARPSAQAKAAVICSLLPWPEDLGEQQRLQAVVRDAMTGRYAAWDALREEIRQANPRDVSLLDPFSGRGMIPLEVARLGFHAAGVEYAPVAVLASSLLIDFPFRDWSAEPDLPLAHDESPRLHENRLFEDVETVLSEIGRRHYAAVSDVYPEVNGKQPWGYFWAVTLPCQECGHRFPIFGSTQLRKPSLRRRRGQEPLQDPGQSFYVKGDRQTGGLDVVVHDGPPVSNPTLVAAFGPEGKKIPGKSAVCVHCDHVHPVALHRRLSNEGLGRDHLLLVAEHDEVVGKSFRVPAENEVHAISTAEAKLAAEPVFTPILPAVPTEEIGPGNNNIIGPSIYGARTYGDFMCARQTLSFVRLSRVIATLGRELADAGISEDYARALTGYGGANMVRMLRYSTRGAWLRARDKGTVEIAGIFVNEGSLAYSYDFFEAGPGTGPGTWHSVQRSSTATLRDLIPERPGRPVDVMRGTVTQLPFSTDTWQVVVTDPPYDQMIAYADSSDLLYSWLKRALSTTWPEMSITADPTGTQEKVEEIIVKRAVGLSKGTFREHRTREHYDTKIAQAFSEMRRVVRDDGLVTIVFGHGEPEVWQRLLSAIQSAGLVMTASWPANTESGGQQGKANIETTLTMACRPAPAGRGQGRKGTVESEIKAEIARRYPDWERWGLAPADMVMAAAGPAMEVVGRYCEVLDSRGEPVDIHTFLPLARSAVQEAMAVEIDHRQLDTFDARTRFALWWARLYGRQPQAKSELRWQALASSMDLDQVRDLVVGDKGVALVASAAFSSKITRDSAIIDTALALARASGDGIAAMGEELAASQFDPDDQFLWAAIQFLAERLPDSDPDSVAFHRVLRARGGIGSAAENVAETVRAARACQDVEDRQIKLL
jgi:putative DNA methylase